MATTKFNMFLTEAEVLRNGNESLLNNLEEGLIIQQYENHEILFQNTAAKRIQNESEVKVSMSVVNEIASLELGSDLKIFGLVDNTIFKNTPIDV